MPCYLFIYGTLRPDRAPREIAPTVRKLKPLDLATGKATGSATIRGRLLDLGEYPGLVLAGAQDLTPQGREEESGEIAGEVYEVPDLATLDALDRYEDFRPADPEASLFLRVEAPVTMSDGSTRICWVYVYNAG